MAERAGCETEIAERAAGLTQDRVGEAGIVFAEIDAFIRT